MFQEFLADFTRITRAPRVVGNLIALVIALAGSVSAAAAIYWTLDHGGASTARNELFLPPGSAGVRDAGDVILQLIAVIHQVPLERGADVWINAPLVLLAIPLLATIIATAVVRLWIPRLGTGGLLLRVVPFGLFYGLALMILTSWLPGGSWAGVSSAAFIYGAVIGSGGVLLHDMIALQRSGKSRGEKRGGWRRSLAVSLRVFLVTIGISALGMFATNLIEQSQSRAVNEMAYANAALFVVDGGFEVFGFSALGKSQQFGDGDSAVYAWELHNHVSAPTQFALLLFCVLFLLLAGLYSGYAAARAGAQDGEEPRAWHGALTGIVWGAAALFASYIVLQSASSDNSYFQLFDKSELFVRAVLVGGVFGWLGAVLARRAHEDRFVLSQTGNNDE